jgi:hypothetical protein
MMATKRQLERKKKAREAKAKARVESRRHKISLATKEHRRGEKLNHKFREKVVPFVKDPEKKRIMEEVEKKKSLQKLERNMQILKALEDEYEQNKEQKKLVNEQLESEGHLTLKEKIQALESKARDSLEGIAGESGQMDLTSP